MSSIITNKATIHYNNTSTKTDPASTLVEPNIEVSKHAYTCQDGIITSTGTVGEDRTVVYDILLVNHSSTPFTNIVIDDFIKIDGVVPTDQAFTYDRDNSSHANSATGTNEIKIEIDSLDPESQLQVYYTLIFNDDIAVGKTISNKASVNYDENIFLDSESEEKIPFNTEEIQVTVDYSNTEVTASKTAPENIYCGQSYEYTLTFTNNGSVDATGVSITDDIPSSFTPRLDKIAITNDTSPLTLNTDFTATIEDGQEGEESKLVINSVENQLDIKPGKTLVVVIPGTHICQ